MHVACMEEIKYGAVVEVCTDSSGTSNIQFVIVVSKEITATTPSILKS